MSLAAINAPDEPLGQQATNSPARRNQIAVYLREHNKGSMVLLTLLPRGEDKLVISRHFPGCLDFGMIPIGLV